MALIEYRYDVPFKFTGKIDKLTFKLESYAGRERRSPGGVRPPPRTIRQRAAD